VIGCTFGPIKVWPHMAAECSAPAGRPDFRDDRSHRARVPMQRLHARRGGDRFVVVRRAILFPAIAVDAPSATWSKARLDTKGSSWRVAFVFVLTALPILVINGLLAWLWLSAGPGTQAQPSAGSFLFFSVIGAVIAIAALCAFAAAASHIYRARADIMTRPR